MDAFDLEDSSSDSFATDDEESVRRSQVLSEGSDDDDDQQDAEDSSEESESAASGDELEDHETFDEGDHNSDDEACNSPSARSWAATIERESVDDGKSDSGLERTASQKNFAGGKGARSLKKKGSKTTLVAKHKEGKLETTTRDFSLQVDVRKDLDRVKPTKDKALLYKLTSGGQYNCIRHAFKRAGFYATSGNHFNVMWGKPLKNPQFKQLNEYQKVNHFPGMYLLGRKDNLARACNRFRRTFGPDAFPYLPKTFVLPADRAELLADFEEQKRLDPNQMYIVKPPASCKGIGIRLVSDPSTQIKEKAIAVVSRYISDPLLVNGHKFDLRIYVTITSFQPLRIYVHEHGMARFCTVKYSSKTRKNRYRHLTNYSLNKNNPDFIRSSGTDVESEGHKWTMRAVWQWLADRNLDPGPVQQRIDDLIVKTILAVETQINTLVQLHVPHRNSCFQLLGFDVMLDSKLHPWLMEVNTGLSLATDSPLDKLLKNTVVTELLHMIQVQGFDRRKLGEQQAKGKTRRLQGKERGAARSHADNVRRRDVCAGRVSALPELNEEDAEVLLECEEEFKRCGGYRRLFPCNDAATRSQQELFGARRFCNVLLHEWITRDNTLSVQDYLDGRHLAHVRPKPLRRANTGPQLSLLHRSEGSFRTRTAFSDPRGCRSVVCSPRGRAGEEEGEEGEHSPHSDQRAAHSPPLSPARLLLSPDNTPSGAWAVAARRGQEKAEGMRVLLDSMAAGFKGSAGPSAPRSSREREALFVASKVRPNLQVGAMPVGRKAAATGRSTRRSVGGEGTEKVLPPLRALQQHGQLLALLHASSCAVPLHEGGRCRSPGGGGGKGVLRRGGGVVEALAVDGAAG